MESKDRSLQEKKKPENELVVVENKADRVNKQHKPSPRQISVAILAECQSYAFPNLAFVIARPPSTQDFPREKFGFRIANT